MSFDEFVDMIKYEERSRYRPDVNAEVIIQDGEIERTEENKYRLEYLCGVITKSCNNGRKHFNLIKTAVYLCLRLL